MELSIVVPIRGRNIQPLLSSAITKWSEIIPVHYNDGLWNISRAVNIGIRRSKGRIVAKVDADLVLSDSFIDDVLGAGDRFCVAPVRRLPKGMSVETADDYPVWGDLSAKYWPCGGWQSAPRDFWFDIHGYDEDMILYGAEDTDMWNRAELAGLQREILNPVIHRWHETQAHRFALFHAGNARLRESRIDRLVRNSSDWGSCVPLFQRELMRWFLRVIK